MLLHEHRRGALLVLALAAAWGLALWLFLDAGIAGPPSPRIAALQGASPWLGSALGLLAAGAILAAGSGAARRWPFGLLAFGVAGALLLAAGGLLAVERLGAGAPPGADLAVLGVAALVAGVALLRELALRAAPRSAKAAWTARHGAALVFAVLLLAAYLAVRPSLAPRVDVLAPWEYLIGVAAALLLLRQGLRGAAGGERAPRLAWASRARKHATRIAMRPDPRMREAAAAIEAFISSGEPDARRRYAAMVEEALEVSPLPLPISQEVHRLLAQAERPAPVHEGWRGRRADARARDARLQLHEAIVARLGGPSPSTKVSP